MNNFTYELNKLCKDIHVFFMIKKLEKISGYPKEAWPYIDFSKTTTDRVWRFIDFYEARLNDLKVK